MNIKEASKKGRTRKTLLTDGKSMRSSALDHMKCHCKCLSGFLVFCSTLPIVWIAQGGQALADGYTPGVPWQGEPGIQENTAAIMERQRAEEGRSHPLRIHPALKHEEVELPLYLDQTGLETVGGETPIANA